MSYQSHQHSDGPLRIVHTYTSMILVGSFQVRQLGSILSIWVTLTLLLRAHTLQQLSYRLGVSSPNVHPTFRLYLLWLGAQGPNLAFVFRLGRHRPTDHRARILPVPWVMYTNTRSMPSPSGGPWAWKDNMKCVLSSCAPEIIEDATSRRSRHAR